MLCITNFTLLMPANEHSTILILCDISLSLQSNVAQQQHLCCLKIHTLNVTLHKITATLIFVDQHS